NHNGFRHNLAKLRVRKSWNRQVVTGLTVNAKPNPPRRMIRRVQSELHVAQKYGTDEAKSRKIRGQIAFIGQVRGQSDPLFLRLLARWHTVAKTIDPNMRLPNALVLAQQNSTRFRCEFDSIEGE